MGADITYHDPFVPSMRIENPPHESSPYSIKLLTNADAVVITTPRTASLTERDPRALQARDRLRGIWMRRVERRPSRTSLIAFSVRHPFYPIPERSVLFLEFDRRRLSAALD